MSNVNIIRAWKDPIYRNSLSDAERAALPPNPAGAVEISDADLGKVAGGADKGNTTLVTKNPIVCSGMCSLNHTGICRTSSLLCGGTIKG